MDTFGVPKARTKPERPTTRLQKMEIIPLGSGAEVGRSCHVLRYKGKTVMLDCGMHPGYSGAGALPFFDEVDPAEVDLLLITHFHLDHAAGLPYFTKTAQRQNIYDPPDKSSFENDDYRTPCRVSDDMLFDSKDLDRCLAKVEPLVCTKPLKSTALNFLVTTLVTFSAPPCL